MLEPDAIAADFRPSLRSTVAAEEVDGEVVLYDEVTRDVHVLNGSAAAIASCFDGESTVADIAAELAAAFAQPVETVMDGVLDVARRLGTASLLVGVEGTAAVAPSPTPDGDEA